ncbi:O-antigen ligase [Litoreibacter halocynthiae]|uniref:O-antigen ligase n=1 Tax=Litoreibacter halocynthiae TaxID=1242689 RepID=A0A4R7LDI6_9RHOB|nr:O-antigen ligase family protein [Litoreibacter halocynthiae]TDT73653.1 O-antigen ligase [Litoreibacter halocynthiae]
MSHTILTNPDAKLSPLVVLYLVAVALPVRYSLGPIQMTGLRTVLALVFVPVLISYIRNPPAKGLSTDLLFALFAFWSLVAFSQTSPTHALENTGALTLELLGGFLIARRYIRTPEQFRATVKVVAAIVLLSLPLAIAESITGHPPLIALVNALPAVTSVAPLSIEPRLGLERAQVLFAHPIHYGLFASTLTALTFVGMAGSWSLWARVIGLGLGISASFLALSSGAFLSVLLQTFLIIWALVFPRWGKRWLFLAIIALIAYVTVDLISNRTPVRVFFSYATFSAHNAYWRGIIFEWGMLNIWQNPLFGIGLNDWVRPQFMHSGSIDNFWLVLGMRYGLPGFAIFTCAYILGFTRVLLSSVPSDLSDIRRAWVICFVGLTFTLCTVHIWTSIFSFVFFLFGAGLWMISPAAVTKKPSPKRATNRFTRFAAVPA